MIGERCMTVCLSAIIYIAGVSWCGNFFALDMWQGLKESLINRVSFLWQQQVDVE